VSNWLYSTTWASNLPALLCQRTMIFPTNGADVGASHLTAAATSRKHVAIDLVPSAVCVLGVAKKKTEKAKADPPKSFQRCNPVTLALYGRVAV